MSNPSVYIDPGYVEDGYLLTPCPVALVSGATRVDLRAPSALSGSVRLLQPEEYSTGWARFGYPSVGVIHSLKFDYNRLNATERSALDSLLSVVDFSSQLFNYVDANSGTTYPVRFQSPEQSCEWTAADVFRTSFVLWSPQPFFTAAVPASLDALLAAARYPATIKRARKQLLTRFSDGSVCIYNKSAITRTTHTRSLLRMTVASLASLIAHFVAHGTRDTWTWNDTAGGATRTVLHAATQLDWSRSSQNTGRYDVQLSLEEDL